MVPTSSFVTAIAFALVPLSAGCSLVLDEPTPFVEARKDAQIFDRGPLLPDLAVEDAFVGREPLDMAPDLAPDAETDAGDCPDGGCLDGGM